MSVIVQVSVKLTPEQVSQYPSFDFVITPLNNPADKVIERANFNYGKNEQ
jgi:hypothetical protein